jgi:hypothetical protein
MFAAMLGTMLALLFASLCIWKTTASGDDRPKPTPQVMAPQPAPSDSSGMVYAVGSTYVDRRGY